MTWKRVSSVVRRLEFVKLALKAQQSMSQLCEWFGLSRKSGYKWKARFLQEGVRGLRDRKRRPGCSPQHMGPRWLGRIRRLHRRHRTGGSRKLAARLRKDYPRQRAPAARTVGKWLKQMKLVRRPRRRSRRGPSVAAGPLTVARHSNHVWTVDFKGWFRTQDGRRVEPLTVRDLFSLGRNLLHVRPRRGRQVMAKARRGEIWLIDLGMTQKARPCLVLSIDFLDHERAVVTYVPRTTHLRQTRFEVPHQARGFEPGAFDPQGIGSIPEAKLERRLGVLEPASVQRVEEALKRWLALA